MIDGEQEAIKKIAEIYNGTRRILNLGFAKQLDLPITHKSENGSKIAIDFGEPLEVNDKNQEQTRIELNGEKYDLIRWAPNKIVIYRKGHRVDGFPDPNLITKLLEETENKITTPRRG